MRKIQLLFVLALLIFAPLATSTSTIASNSPQTGSETALTGGPDAFGYTFFDQDDGCAYDYIDISATGTNVGTGDDEGFPITLGAAFNIYGTDFTTLAVTSNGYISTDSTDNGPDISNDCPIPAVPSTGGGARLYALHDDLVVDGGLYTQYFVTCPRENYPGESEPCTVVMWSGTRHFVDGGSFDFEAILYHNNNDIVYQYGTGDPELGAGATIGMQDFPPPTTALMYGCNTANMYTGGSTAICIRNPDSEPLPYVPSAEDHARAQAPLCAGLDGSTTDAVRADIPGGAVTNGGVYCRMLDDDMAGMGNGDLLAMGPIHAVDVFGMAGSTSYTSFNSSVKVCLQGTGNLAFLDASGMPRPLSWMQTTVEGGYTCARLTGAGTLVLVP